LAGRCNLLNFFASFFIDILRFLVLLTGFSGPEQKYKVAPRYRGLPLAELRENASDFDSHSAYLANTYISRA
jgi:hypothetical protein